MRVMPHRFFVLCYLLCLPFTAVGAAEVRVAVASNFLHTAQALASGFEQRSGHRVIISSGSTGKLYAQILHGAPFDLFLAANTTEPKKLLASEHAVADSYLVYAVGKLVLWGKQVEEGSDCIASLQTVNFQRMALANPELAPYGKAAMEIITALGVEERIKGRLVMGENIGQTFQFVASGNVDGGFISQSQLAGKAHLPAGGTCVPPQRLYSPIEQAAVVLKRAKDNAAAMEFMRYLKSPAAQALIRSEGYGID